MQPYKEDSDDETGFIMGAWQPFPGPGYSAMEEPPAPAPSPPKSGFSRVAGGRAHYESPYAITSGSTQTFPSVERGAGSVAQPSVVDYSPPGTPSILSAARGLPPGAMPPSAHVRTKSQTAIIENVSAALPYRGAAGAAEPDARGEAAGDDVAALGQPKKKHWFNRRKNRRMSESDALPSTPPGQEAGRSFVVVRKQRPGAPSPSSSSAPPAEDVVEQERGPSFSVLRGPAHSDPQTPFYAI